MLFDSGHHSFILFYLVCLFNQGKQKQNIDKWSYTELKRFNSARKTINRQKRQSAEGEKIFAKTISVKELMFKLYRYLIQLNIKMTHKMILKSAK